jgi:hypothetical protein
MPENGRVSEAGTRFRHARVAMVVVGVGRTDYELMLPGAVTGGAGGSFATVTLTGVAVV